MDIKTYIESGILENYILGSLSPQEAKEVQKMAAQYPEIQVELDNIETALADFAQSHAVAPPPYMKAKILQTIENLSVVTPKVTPPPPPAITNNWPLLAGIIGILMIVKAATIIYFYQKNEEFKKHSTELQLKITKLQNDSNQTQNRLKQLEEKMQIIQDENIKSIILWNKNDERSKANVYWKDEEPIAYIDAHNIAEPPKGKQYQLWALDKDDEPTNLGVVAIDAIPVDELLEIKLKTDDFVSFAISLEDTGSDDKRTPDWDAIVMSEKT